jgi:predicted aldo/keto reductase-like oxidoreductase
LNQPVATIVPGVTTLAELELDAAIGHLDDYTLTADEQAQVNMLAEQLQHVRCRVCRACEPYCPQHLWLGDVLGSEVMYDHYRTMGREAFASAPWSVSFVAGDDERQAKLVSSIESCGECRKCEEHCPYGLPAPDMLRAMLPSLQDMLGIYEQRLRR